MVWRRCAALNEGSIVFDVAARLRRRALQQRSASDRTGKEKGLREAAPEPRDGYEPNGRRSAKQGRSSAAPLRRMAVKSVGGDEVAAAVLLPAGLVGFHAEGLLLAEADGADAVGGDA